MRRYSILIWQAEIPTPRMATKNMDMSDFKLDWHTIHSHLAVGNLFMLRSLKANFIEMPHVLF